MTTNPPKGGGGRERDRWQAAIVDPKEENRRQNDVEVIVCFTCSGQYCTHLVLPPSVSPVVLETHG